MSEAKSHLAGLPRHVTWFSQVSVLACCAVVLTLGCQDSKERLNDAVANASTQLRPVIQQLDAYKVRTGKYPLGLNELVISGDLRSVPACPCIGESRDLRYMTDNEQSFFWMVVAFEFEGWGYYLHYVSFEQRWEVTKYPPKFETLVMRNKACGNTPGGRGIKREKTEALRFFPGGD